MFCLPQVPKRNADDDDDVPHVQPVMPLSSSYYNANGYRHREDDGSLVPYGKLSLLLMLEKSLLLTLFFIMQHIATLSPATY